MAIDFLERDVEDYVVVNPDLIGCHRIYDRQVRLPEGVVDVIGIRDTAEGPIYVVTEIKRDSITHDAVNQLHWYMRTIRAGLPDGVKLVGALLGPAIRTDAALLADSLGYEFWAFKPAFTSRQMPISSIGDVFVDQSDRERLRKALMRRIGSERGEERVCV